MGQPEPLGTGLHGNDVGVPAVAVGANGHAGQVAALSMLVGGVMFTVRTFSLDGYGWLFFIHRIPCDWTGAAHRT